MEDKLKRMEEIDNEIKELQEEFATESFMLTQQEGFDQYKPKWKKKIQQLANKYAGPLYELKEEYNEIVYYLNEQEEEKRKKKYKEISHV